MENGKYDRKITLLCPTCGNNQLEIQNDNQDMIRCPSCDRTMTKEEIINENGELIDINVEEVKQEIVQDLKDTIKNSLKGSKNIRFK
jgi:uncharacterized Zn finger protein (UPF0148 family)